MVERVGAFGGARPVLARAAVHCMEEVLLTLDLCHVDGVRIRMPMACAAIAALVMILAVVLVGISWMMERKGPELPAGGAKTESAAAAEGSRALEAADPARPGRRF